jgi:hypothetical protein
MTEEEWDIVLALVGVGMNECPWGWSEDFPAHSKDKERTEIEATVQKFTRFVAKEKDTLASPKEEIDDGPLHWLRGSGSPRPEA